VQISPSGASRANVSGAVTLAGTLEVVFAPGVYTAHTYDILDPSSITGKFSNVVNVNQPGFTETITYTSTDVLLSLQANLGGGGGGGPGNVAGALPINQQNAANAINGFFNSGGSLPASFTPLFSLSGGALTGALSQIDGEAATGAAKGAFLLTDEFLALMLDPFVGGRGGGSADGAGAMGFAPGRTGVPADVTLAYDEVLKPPAAAFVPRWTSWAAGYGGANRTSGDPTTVGSTDVSARTYGFAGGLDYLVTPGTAVGLALAGGGTNWGLAQGLGGGRSDAFQAGLYGATHFGPAYVAGALSLSEYALSTNRFAIAADQLTASFNAQGYGGRFETGYRVAVTGATGLTPYAAVQAQSFHTPAYSETDATGGGFALGYMAATATDTRTELGSRFDSLTTWGGIPLALRGRVAWAHDWVDNTALTAVFQSLPGASFIVNGAAPAPNSVLVSGGAELHVTPALSLSAKFDGEFAARGQTYAGTGTIRYAW
jgi:uncharacterized protein with beta-barrel porin domain